MSIESDGTNGTAVVDLFRKELGQYVAQLREVVEAASTSVSEDYAQLVKALSGIRFSARMAKDELVAELSGNLLTWLESAGEEAVAGERGEVVLAAVSKAADFFIRAAEGLGRGRDRGLLQEEEAEIIGQLEKAEPVPEDEESPEPATEMPRKILRMRTLFWQELQDRVDELSNCILELEKGNKSPLIIETIMRIAHTLKGSSRLSQIDPIAKLSHTIEDIFCRAQEPGFSINAERVDLLLKAVDCIVGVAKNSLVNEVCSAAEEQEINELNASLKAVLLTKNESDDSPASEEHTAQSEGGQEGAGDGRTLRIDAQSLNRVIGLSGEMMIVARQFEKLGQKELRLLRMSKSAGKLAEKSKTLGKRYQFNAEDQQLMDELFSLSSKIESQIHQQYVDLQRQSINLKNFSDKIFKAAVSQRMRPFAEGLQGFNRLVRALGNQLGKQVKLEVIGKSTMVDGDILERLHIPLTHLINNAVDHGLELPAERSKKGKKSVGTIILEARHCGGMLAVSISDDGGGISREKLRKQIIERGLSNEEMVHAMGDEELFSFLFLPSFSMRKDVSDISGRGVGLDAVMDIVSKVRGRIQVSSKEDSGTKFDLLLPLTLSLSRCVVIELSGYLYAIPVGVVKKTRPYQRESINTVENRQFLKDKEDGAIPLVSASRLLQLPQSNERSESRYIVVIGRGEQCCGLLVDQVINEVNLVERPLDSRLGKIQDVSAAAFLDDGRPVLILDGEDLLLSSERSIASAQYGGEVDRTNNASEEKRILVIDDSLTVREVERSLLSDLGYSVDVAVDGVDGWNALKKNAYDLIVTDIDMPRMNGIELTRELRQDTQYKDVPIVVVSYKDREEDMQRGMEAGADRYLTKGSFVDQSFAECVRDLIGETV